MWKVVVTEIQDASAFEPFDVPVGAFSVSKERFARTMERLDLPSLIDTLEAMQSAQGYTREERPIASPGTPPNRSWLRANTGPQVHRLNEKRSRPTATTQFVSKTAHDL